MEAVLAPVEATFDSRDFLAPDDIDLSPLWSYPVQESAEQSPLVVNESDGGSESPEEMASGNTSEQQQFTIMVEQLNVMVEATIPGSPLASASSSSPSSPHSASSSSFEPEYTPPTRGKRNKAGATQRTAKKARKVKGHPTASSPNSVELTEEELLTWTSDDYATHIGTISAKRRLTDREEQIIKDQKRRIKNRESAQESRERRRAQLEQLQEEVGVLKGEKLTLVEENQRLREEVERLKGTVRQFDGLRSVWNTWTASRKGVNSNAVKAAGMCLLVVLFSFGLLFKHHSPSVTGPRISFFDRASPIEGKLLRSNFAPAPGNPLADSTPSSHYSPSARQRSLLWSENATPSIEEIDAKDLPTARPRTPLVLDKTVPEFSQHAVAKQTNVDVAMSEATPIPELAVNNNANLSNAYHRFTNSNVTFLMCTELGKSLPAPLEGQTFKGDPFVIAFLPEDPTREMSQQTHVTQLTCRLVDVTRAEVRHEPTMATPVVLSAVPNFS